MMPQTIQHADFSDILRKPSSNKTQAKKFIAKYAFPYRVEGLNLPEHFQLLANKKKTSIRLIDRTHIDVPRIAYAVDIEVTHEKIHHQTCTQVIVWANPRNEALLIGFPRKIFNHLLQKYVIMVTDKLQTPDGKRFWERRILQALADNKQVYFCDKTSVQTHLQRILNEDDFFEIFEPKGWGNEKAYQNKWFVISQTVLVS